MGGRISGKTVPKAGIGEQIFAEVEKLTAGGEMKRLAAFKEIAKRSGRQVGTVAANYYRIARQRGVPLRARRGRGVGATAGESRRLNAALQLVGAALRAQDAELEALRDQSAAFEKLRRLLKG